MIMILPILSNIPSLMSPILLQSLILPILPILQNLLI